MSYPICEVCKIEKKSCSLEPSRTQLVRGGFPVRYEYRCTPCETRLVKSIEKMLAKIY